MNKKITAILLVTVIAISSLSMVGLISMSSANPFPKVIPTNKHAYIKSNGEIDPSTLPIQRNGNNYVLTGNIVNYTLEIQRSGISLDGTGFTLQGNFGAEPSTGINLSYVNSVTINNLKINAFDYNIVMNGTSNTKITNSYFNSEVELSNVSASEISGNTFNTFNRGGIQGQCTNCQIDKNYFGVGGILLSQSNGNSITNNFFKDPHYRCVSLATCNNNIISDNTLFINDTSILMGDTTYAPSGIVISDGSAYNSVYRNNIIGSHSSYFINGVDPISGANISKLVHNPVNGFIIYNAHDNVFYDNNIANSEYGIYIDRYYDSTLPIGTPISLNNTFFSNNFSNLTIPFYFYNKASANNWDNGLIGNYWSDYQTIYPQAQAIENSITGDTPYVLNSNNIDRFPLINSLNIDFSSSLPTPISPPAIITINDEPIINPTVEPTVSPSPSPTVPEFPATLAITFLVITGLAVAVVIRKKHSEES